MKRKRTRSSIAIHRAASTAEKGKENEAGGETPHGGRNEAHGRARSPLGRRPTAALTMWRRRTMEEPADDEDTRWSWEEGQRGGWDFGF